MLEVRFLQSGTQITLEQGSTGEKTPVLNLDLKLQLSVANLLEALLKSCESLGAPRLSGDAATQGVANDRRASELPGASPLDEAKTEKENTSAATATASPVTSPVIGPVVQDLPSAAAQLGLVSPPEGIETPATGDAGDDDDMVETGVVGWESFGEPPPGMPEEHASVVSTLLSPKAPIPPAPTTEPMMPEQPYKKRNKMLETGDLPTEQDSASFVGGTAPAFMLALEKDLKELKQRISLANDSQQRQEGELQSNMTSLAGRIHNLAHNMKFQTSAISQHCADHHRRLDNICKNIENLEGGICTELKELKEIGQMNMTTIKDIEAQTLELKELTNAAAAATADTGREYGRSQRSGGKGQWSTAKSAGYSNNW